MIEIRVEVLIQLFDVRRIKISAVLKPKAPTGSKYLLRQILIVLSSGIMKHPSLNYYRDIASRHSSTHNIPLKLTIITFNKD